VFGHKGIGYHLAPVRTGRIVIHWREDSGLFLIQGIGIPSFVTVLKSTHLLEFPTFAHLPHRTKTPPGRLSLIHGSPVEGIGKQPSGVVVVGGYANVQAFGDLRGVGDSGLEVVMVASTQGQAGTLVFFGRFTDNMHQTSHGIAAVKGPLRPTQHLNAFYIKQVEVKHRLFKIGNLIHIQPY